MGGMKILYALMLLAMIGVVQAACTSGSCGTTACPASYCSGNTLYTYAGTCVNPCLNGTICGKCTCTATATSCGTSTLTCPSSYCSGNSRCIYPAASSCNKPCVGGSCVACAPPPCTANCSSCGTKACPVKYCSGNSLCTYPSTCTNTCSGGVCKSCTCTASCAACPSGYGCRNGVCFAVGGGSPLLVKTLQEPVETPQPSGIWTAGIVIIALIGLGIGYFILKDVLVATAPRKKKRRR